MELFTHFSITYSKLGIRLEKAQTVEACEAIFDSDEYKFFEKNHQATACFFKGNIQSKINMIHNDGFEVCDA